MKTLVEFVRGAFWGLLVGLVFMSVSKAGELPVAQLNSEAVGYATMDEAAIAVLRPLVEAQMGAEYGGAIYKCGGMFAASNVVSQGLPHDLNYTINRYKECELVATFHTHPTVHPRAEFFSKNDRETIERLNVVGYIGASNGKIRKRAGLKETLVTIVSLDLTASR